jgi:hypothetical protein
MKNINKVMVGFTILAVSAFSGLFAFELFSSGTGAIYTSHELCVTGVICVDTNYPVLLDDGTILDHTIEDDGRKIVRTLPYPIIREDF